MAVTFFTGFEAQQFNVDAGTPLFSFNGSAAFSTAQARTGAVSVRLNPGSGASGYLGIAASAVITNYIHFGFYVASLPSVDRRLFGGSAGQVGLYLTSTGALKVYDGTTLRGTTSAKFATPGWHWVGVRNVTGTNVALCQIDGTTEVTATLTVTQSHSFIGFVGTEASAVDAYVDDFIVDGAGFLGPSKVDIALPISDNARTAVTTGAGGTTNLWDAVNNTPPVGLASANETATSNIEFPASATESYTANLETYSTLGLASGDTVIAVQSIIRHGEDIATGTKNGTLGAVTNPTISDAIAYVFGSDGGAHGDDSASSTLWRTRLGTLTTSMTQPTLGTSPTLTVSRVSEARVGCIDFMGLHVAWTPAAPTPVTGTGASAFGWATAATGTHTAGGGTTGTGASAFGWGTAATGTTPPTGIGASAFGFSTAATGTNSTAVQLLHDAASESHTGTTGSISEASFTWNHTPVGFVRGVVVFTMNVTSGTDNVTGVTYGGVALTALSGRVSLATGEAGDCEIWFLGSNVPQGVQAIVVTRTNNADELYAVAATMQGAADIRVSTWGGSANASAVPPASSYPEDATNAAYRLIGYLALNSGYAAPPTVFSSATTLISSIDFGTRTAAFATRTAAPSAGTYSIEFDQSGANDEQIYQMVTFTDESIALTTGTSAVAFGWATTASGVMNASGVGASAFTWTDAAVGTEGFEGVGASAFGWSTTLIGIEQVNGPGASIFTWTTAATGTESFTGTAASAFTWGTAASGAAGASGTSAVAFGWSTTAGAVEGIPGTAASIFTWATAATGAELLTGTSTVSFGWSAAATGSLTISGNAASAFGWATAATGSEDISGSAASAFTWGTAATGAAGASGSGASAFTWATAATGSEDISGSAASTFTWTPAATGMVVTGVAGSAASAFTWSTSATGEEAIPGAAASTFGWATDAAGIVVTGVAGTGASAFGWATAGQGGQTITGVADSAFTWATAATGLLTASGAAASAFGWATAATGSLTISGSAASAFTWTTAGTGDEAIPGAAASTFTWTTTAAGSAGASGTGASAFTWSTDATGEQTLPGVTGTGASAFTWATEATGEEAIPGSAASAFGWSTAATGSTPVTGTGASAFGWSTTATGTYLAFGNYPYIVAEGALGTGSAAGAVLPLPAGMQVGDLLIGRLSRRFSGTYVWPSGWTINGFRAPASMVNRFGMAYHYVTGAEGYANDGSDTITVTNGASGGPYSGQVTLIRGARDPYERGSFADTSLAADINTGSLTPSWGAEDTLWLVEVSTRGDPGTIVAPAGYTGGTWVGDVTADTGMGVVHAWKKLNAASEDPGVYSIAGNPASGLRLIAVTMAVRSAPPTGTGASAFGWSTAASGTVTNPTDYSAVAFTWSTAATGVETMTGTAASAFGWSTAGTGSLQPTGVSASAFGWSTAATGSEDIPGTSAVAFGWSTYGSDFTPITGTGASAFGWWTMGIAASPALPRAGGTTSFGYSG